MRIRRRGRGSQGAGIILKRFSLAYQDQWKLRMLQTPGSLTVGAPYSLAIGIKKAPNSKQKHVALLYRDDASAWWLIHLGWHHRLHNEPWDGSYYWLAFSPALRPEVIESVTDAALLIGTHEGQ